MMNLLIGFLVTDRRTLPHLLVHAAVWKWVWAGMALAAAYVSHNMVALLLILIGIGGCGSLWIETVGRATQDMRKPWSNGLAASYARAATIARNTRNGYRHALRMGLGAICIIIFIEARHAIFDVNILCPAVLLAIMVIDEQLRQWTPALPQKFND